MHVHASSITVVAMCFIPIYCIYCSQSSAARLVEAAQRHCRVHTVQSKCWMHMKVSGGCRCAMSFFFPCSAPVQASFFCEPHAATHAPVYVTQLHAYTHFLHYTLLALYSTVLHCATLCTCIAHGSSVYRLFALAAVRCCCCCAAEFRYSALSHQHYHCCCCTSLLAHTAHKTTQQLLIALDCHKQPVQCKLFCTPLAPHLPPAPLLPQPRHNCQRHSTATLL